MVDIDNLLKALSDHINNSKTNRICLSEELFLLSQSHQLEGIVYYQTKCPELKQAYLKCVSDYVNRRKLLNQITLSYEDKTIPYYIVKGAYIAPHYPVPALRTMGDCDIIVPFKDKHRVEVVFNRLGFVDKTNNYENEWVYLKNGFELEIHHSLFYERDMCSPNEIQFLSQAWRYVTESELDPYFHFVYLLSHIKKHLLNCGVGFRQFMDLAIEIKYGSVDGDRIKEFAEQAGLLKFTGVFGFMRTMV